MAGKFRLLAPLLQIFFFFGVSIVSAYGTVRNRISRLQCTIHCETSQHLLPSRISLWSYTTGMWPTMFKSAFQHIVPLELNIVYYNSILTDMSDITFYCTFPTISHSLYIYFAKFLQVNTREQNLKGRQIWSEKHF